MVGSTDTATRSSVSTSGHEVDFDIDTAPENAAKWLKHAHNWADMEVAQRAVMINNSVRGLARAEALERFAMTGDKTELDPAKVKAEEMAVSVGNESHYHFESQSPSKGNGLLRPALVAAGLIMGSGLAGLLLSNVMKPTDVDKPVSAPGEVIDYDINSSITPSFGTPTTREP